MFDRGARFIHNFTLLLQVISFKTILCCSGYIITGSINPKGPITGSYAMFLALLREG
jgi:hypothetical protein